MQSGDIRLLTKNGESGIAHVWIVQSVDKNGAITVVDESTGVTTVYDFWDDFVKAMQAQNKQVEGFDRIDSTDNDDGDGQPQAYYLFFIRT